MSFSKFMTKQEKIYGEFRDTSKIQIEGLIPQISQSKGGYIIALRHSDDIVTGIENFTEKISRVTSSIKYDRSNIHTTLATYEVVDRFSPIRDILDNLANIVYNNISLIKKMEIEYCEWMINQDSGIARGIPNIAFYENVKK